MPETTGAVCEQFLLCANPAEGVTEHAILGLVPSCARCAAKLELDLLPFPTASVGLYTSPLRPLDVGYVERLTGIAVDWSRQEIGHWHRGTVYAFTAALPPEIVDSFELTAIV